jgi:hypothetical protein
MKVMEKTNEIYNAVTYTLFGDHLSVSGVFNAKRGEISGSEIE